MGCTTTALAGYDGKVEGLAGTAEVYKWEVDETLEALDASAFGSQWKQYVAGMKTFTGTLSARGARFSTGADAGVAFITHTSGITLTGDIIITSSVVNVEVDGIVDFTATFQGCGSLVES